MQLRRLTAGIDRRAFLGRAASGMGALAFAQLLARDGLLGPATARDLNGGIHHRAKVRRIVHLFMNGGASPMDTFDYKPELERRHGQVFDPGSGRVEAATSTPGTILKSPFAFAQHGQCGRFVSSVLPQLAGHVDDLAFLMAMVSKTNVHGPGVYLQNTGFVNPGFPSIGSWVSFALGSMNDDLPAYVVIPDARGLPYNSKGSFSSGFLPVSHQGVLLKPSSPDPLADLFPPASAAQVTAASEADGRQLLAQLDRNYLADRPGDSRLEARIRSYELAARMQLSAPDALDISRESAATRSLYGLDQEPTRDFGRSCLVARRLLERDVRFVQLWSGTAGALGNWDNHADIQKELTFIATSVDQPIAALLQDLGQRGLLADTLVVWTTEFGRMPFSQGSTGRDHNGGTFVSWLAGAGVRAGTSFGESDPWGWKAAKDATSGYDLHATILHLLGIDHKKLTFRHDGSDRRLTDVHGHVIHEVLA
ncbi:MAG TPA: DUF1501 domain-containing protein [Planctomycetota bacterium]|nr:DUF1501 domain-containing protein [Planctomycetota bacterium]